MSTTQPKTQNGIDPDLIYPRDTIADFLGLNRVTVARALAGHCRVIGRIPLVRLADVWDLLPTNTAEGGE